MDQAPVRSATYVAAANGKACGPQGRPLQSSKAHGTPTLHQCAHQAGHAVARAAARREIAFYVGSMGSRERNYYRDAVAGMGFGDECAAIQDAALDGRRADAEIR